MNDDVYLLWKAVMIRKVLQTTFLKEKMQNTKCSIKPLE